MSLFGTAGIRGDVADRVTPELALSVGRAVGYEAADRGIETVVVGRDGRVTGPALAAAVEAGLASAGVSVLRAGRLPTPALSYASRERLGVMLTASHNPPFDNGIKLFVDGVEFDADAEARIDGAVDEEPPPASWEVWTAPEAAHVLPGYREAVFRYASRYGSSLAGLSIALDCGNGTAALAAPQVLETMGADVTAINANVDGHFPGRRSKPTPDSLADFRRFVAGGDHELGIAHDGDADRIVVVDGVGDVVHEDTVLAVLAERYVEEAEAAEPVVVTTPNASGRIDERVEAAGGRTRRVPLGSLAGGIASAREAGEVVAFAAEPWKHVHPRFGDWIDGIASASVLARLVAEAGSLDALTASVTERPYRKDEVHCPEERKAGAMDRVASELPERFLEASVELQHGVRLDLPDGSWVLVRPSGTEPLLRLYVESDDVDELLAKSRAVVEAAVSE